MKIVKFDKSSTDFLVNKHIAIVVANFYKNIADKLLAGALAVFQKYSLSDDNIDIYYIPGAFEVPVMCKHLAKTTKYDGIVTLGAVIKGQTPHFDYICREASSGVAEIARSFGLPIAFGILTTNNKQQALDRAGGNKGNKGEEAALALIEMIYLLKQSYGV